MRILLVRDLEKKSVRTKWQWLSNHAHRVIAASFSSESPDQCCHGRSSGLPAQCSPSHPKKQDSDFLSRRKILGIVWNVAPGQHLGHCQDHSIGHYAAASHRLPFSPSTTTIMVFGTESCRIWYLIVIT